MKRAIALFALVAAAFHTSAADTVSSIRIRAASCNVRCSGNESDSNNNWDRRKEDLANLVGSIAPDVIGFQEVRSGQYEYLQDKFPEYAFVGEMRDSSSNSEASPVAFRKERFTLLESGTFWLSATPEVPGSKAWGDGIENSGYARICTWTLLKEASSGNLFCFACTHLDLKDGPRLAGMQLILSRLAKFLDSGVPVVLVGDMNALETESSMLAATEKLQDAMLVSKTKPIGSWRTFNAFSWIDDEVSCSTALAEYSAAERTANVEMLGKRIDYIFTTKGVEVESFAIRNDARPGMRYYPSDHYPVAADLVLPSLGEAWLRESAATSGWTGEWSENVNYGEDGRAYLSGDVAFEPTNASTGNVVTVEMKTQFNECVKDTNPDATAQAAVRLGPNGRFQVWTHLRQGYGGQVGWVDVEAEGGAPVSGEEYTLRFTFDYRNGTYSVEIKTGLSEFTRLVGVKSSATTSTPTQYSNSNFMIANAANRVSSIAFVGDTLFTSLDGACRYAAIGFQPGEISVGDATIILDAAKAAWLNARGDYAAVNSRLANITSNEFATAWLCNLDIMNETASAELKITSIKVNADNVEIAVALTRTGAISPAINGSLKFYGAETLAQFKSNATKPIASTTLADEDFSEGDTVIRLFPKDDNVFFKAGIEE